MEELTIKEQIKILEEAKDYYFLMSGYLDIGMCLCINQMIKDKYKIYKLVKISKFIPTFTFKHIKELTKDTQFEPTETYKNNYFWDIKNTFVREKVFYLLINELKHKINSERLKLLYEKIGEEEYKKINEENCTLSYALDMCDFYNITK